MDHSIKTMVVILEYKGKGQILGFDFIRVVSIIYQLDNYMMVPQ